MRVAVTFCGQTKHEYRKNKDGYLFFHWSEAESLPHFNELETPVLFDHECAENFASIRGPDTSRSCAEAGDFIGACSFCRDRIGIDR